MTNLLVKIFWWTLPGVLIMIFLWLGLFGIPAAPMKIQKEIWPIERRT